MGLFGGKRGASAETKELTLLYSEVRAFSTISGYLNPEQLFELLNDFVTPMHEVVLKQKGRLGCIPTSPDTILAVFEGKTPQEAAAAGCVAALEMMTALEGLHSRWRETGLPELEIGIGISSGPMLLGTVGLLKPPSFVVTGSHTNLGLRLSSLSRMYSAGIVVSEYVAAAVGSAFSMRELDLVNVKGKRDPLMVFELIGKHPPSEQQAGLLAKHARGLALYKNQKWDEAIAVFSHIVDDFVAQMYIDRCTRLKADPPGEDWNGVFTLTAR